MSFFERPARMTILAMDVGMKYIVKKDESRADIVFRLVLVFLLLPLLHNYCGKTRCEPDLQCIFRLEQDACRTVLQRSTRSLQYSCGDVVRDV